MVILFLKTVVIHGKFSISVFINQDKMNIIYYSFCSRNKKVCKGQPCYTTTTTTTIISTISTSTTSNPISDQNINKTIEKLCLNGWSAWIHINQLNSSKVLSKYEYMPTFYDLKSKEYNNLKEVKNKVITIIIKLFIQNGKGTLNVNTRKYNFIFRHLECVNVKKCPIFNVDLSNQKKVLKI